MRMSALLLIAGLACAGSAQAQVIEIDDDGQARTFDGPATFGLAADQPAQAPKPASAVARGDAFERAAKKHGVDVNLLRAVAWTESRGRNDAVSPKGAMGIMQLMPGTAAELGVDPRDPDSNIAGGAAYLARQINHFGNIPLALAAYNAGPAPVIRFRGIPPYAETRSYVSSVMRRWGGQVAPRTLPGAMADGAVAIRKAPSAARSLPAAVMLIEVPAP